MVVPPQFPAYRWRGLPFMVKRQLHNIGVGAKECVLCGSPQHGCFECAQRNTPRGRSMWEAWDKFWLHLIAKELALYALCYSDAEYQRRSGALYAPAPVSHSVVLQFRQYRRPSAGAPQQAPTTRSSRSQPQMAAASVRGPGPGAQSPRLSGPPRTTAAPQNQGSGAKAAKAPRPVRPAAASGAQLAGIAKRKNSKAEKKEEKKQQTLAAAAAAAAAAATVSTGTSSSAAVAETSSSSEGPSTRADQCLASGWG